MVKLAFTFGTLLVLLGIGFYIALAPVHWTVLMPAIFGVPLLICGGLATLGAGWRKHAMHAALLVAVVGAIGAGMRIPGIVTKSGFGASAVEHLLMVLLCLAFVALGVRSFIAARVKNG